MKVGDLVKSTFLQERGDAPFREKIGLIVKEDGRRGPNKSKWFWVSIAGKTHGFTEDYLEVVND